MSRLDGQVALVTGASSGLGRATATALARAGATTALLARTASDLEQAVEALGADGHRALAVACDLADADGLERAVARVHQELGPVRVLVNAAGSDAPGPVTQLRVADWDRVMAINLRAVFLLSRLVLPGMADAGQGTIVNVSSVAGRRGWANASAYCASKFALTGFTQALNAETREHGVRTCVVYPGAMATHWGTWQPEDRRTDDGEPADPETSLPPETVADFIAWLATAPFALVSTRRPSPRFANRDGRRHEAPVRSCLDRSSDTRHPDLAQTQLPPSARLVWDARGGDGVRPLASEHDNPIASL